MEISKGLNSWSLIINELTQGRNLAKELQNHLHTSTPHETREYLIEKILSTYNRALQMANLTGDSSPADPSQINFHGGCASESPRSVSHCSVRSAGSSDLENHRCPSKKRRTTPQLIKMVKVSAGAGGGTEGPPSDGFNWRKYGQKDILGAAFPRNYYRCTHRPSQGCNATKQIQKSDDDPTVYQVIYNGSHTCSQSSHVKQPSTSRNLPPAPGEPTNPIKPEPAQHHPLLEQQEKQNHSQQIALDQPTVKVQPQIKVETEDLYTKDLESFFFRSFSFSSVFLEPTGVELANTWFFSDSPATSDSNHLQSPAGHICGGNGVWTPESDINDHGVSGPNSPTDRLEFTLDELGIDPNFSFDNPELFH